MEPKIGTYPLEVFGYVYTNIGETATNARKMQYCPFLDRECTKPRKSEPQIKVGICSVGFKGKFLNAYAPVIICPSRFLEGVVFQTVHDRFFPDWKNTRWVKEVSMGVSGNVDFVALRMDEAGNNAEDFFCVEFQASGTTGSPYPYVKDLMKNGKYSKKHTFGVNWANEYMKTMMQQVYKKGSVVSAWGRKIVFVIQDVALKYLESTVDTSELRMDMNDPIHFMTYREIWNEQEEQYKLDFDRWVSADIDGIKRILAGANPDDYLTEELFLNKAISKGISDGVLDVRKSV